MLQLSKRRMQFLRGENKRDLLPTVRFLEAELLAPKGLVTKSALQRLQDYELQTADLTDLPNMEFWTDRRVRISTTIQRRAHRNDRHQYYRKQSREKAENPCHLLQRAWWMNRIETPPRVSKV